MKIKFDPLLILVVSGIVILRLFIVAEGVSASSHWYDASYASWQTDVNSGGAHLDWGNPAPSRPGTQDPGPGPGPAPAPAPDSGGGGGGGGGGGDSGGGGSTDTGGGGGGGGDRDRDRDRNRCNPSCGAPLCGQADGCGGSCSSSDNSWSSCSAPSYTRTNACVGTETCKGTISGTMFNSTLPGSSCANPGEGVAGVTVSAAASGTAPGGCSVSGTAVTDGNGNYSIGNLCSPATYLMTIDAPADWIDEPDSYCDGGLSANLTSQGQTEDKDFGLTKIYDGWVQVNDGDVYAAGVISNYIPPSCTGACVARFLLDGAAGQPGVVGFGGWSANFGRGEVSSTNWLVNATYKGKRYGFEFWRTHWNVSAKAESDWTNVELFTSASKPTRPPIHEKVYYANDDMIIADSTWQIANGEKIAVLVRGNLDIKAKITVAPGGFLAFAVSGDINIDPSINSEDGQGAVEGIYMADGEIDTGRATTKLILEGTFVGWTGVNLKRDFQTVRNNTEPAEVFVYRPDIIAASPSYMKRPAYVWEEVAP